MPPRHHSRSFTAGSSSRRSGGRRRRSGTPSPTTTESGGGGGGGEEQDWRPPEYPELLRSLQEDIRLFTGLWAAVSGLGAAAGEAAERWEGMAARVEAEVREGSAMMMMMMEEEGEEGEDEEAAAAAAAVASGIEEEEGVRRSRETAEQRRERIGAENASLEGLGEAYAFAAAFSARRARRAGRFYPTCEAVLWDLDAELQAMLRLCGLPTAPGGGIRGQAAGMPTG